ncbi:MAG: AAA domain-containing protein [Eubacteriales bacterium]
MDARNNMIIAKGDPITSRVHSCNYNPATRKWDVVFQGGKKFSYAYQNILWLKNPVSLNPDSYHVSCKGKVFDNITSIFSFSDGHEEYWHICFSTGYENDYCKRDLKIDKSCLDNNHSAQIFTYLKKIAESVSVKSEDDTAILAKQYEKTNFLSENNAVAVYLNPEEYRSGTGINPNPLIFPFGCNESQYCAVEQAITNHVSVIEGPPGTGKTQTILNIIANLLIREKTVQVVSNNNSAIENIIEKLSSPKYGMDFFVASLGRVEKKELFVSSQTGHYPDLTSWGNRPAKSGYEIAELGQKLQEVFINQNRRAVLTEKRKAVEIEQKHFCLLFDGRTEQELLPFHRLDSTALLKLYQEVEAFLKDEAKMGFFRRIAFQFKYGFSFKIIQQSDPSTLLPNILTMYYPKVLSEMDAELKELTEALENADAEKLSNDLTNESLSYFRKHLFGRYGNIGHRPVFEKDDLWRKIPEFLNEYPVVLSTTYTARSSLGKEAQFDYVIMDEASQVDVATGALAISCAHNAVIVGDNKQLPNVVTKQQKEILTGVFQAYKIPQAYDFTSFSFLDSFYQLLERRIPKTILSEHYRCDPQIIGYCNQKYYQNQLIVMTSEHEKALNLVTTVSGNHKREQANLRQAEVIRDEILPQTPEDRNNIGIITPYRHQVALLKQAINDPEIEIATVHKFQGREKDVIIYCTVDDMVTEFSDDPNLLNVAISRAKKQLYIVASEMEQPIGSNVGDLIGYIRYHNCSEIHSSISSVFDYLYEANEKERFEFLKKHKRISEYDSENLFFALIEDELKERNEVLGVICHQPLYTLLRDYSQLNEEECCFVKTCLSHLDFLIYNKVTKQPLLAIEVDGYNFHKADSKQGNRDRLKDHIMEVTQIPLLRFSTNGSGEREKLRSALEQICRKTLS